MKTKTTIMRRALSPAAVIGLGMAFITAGTTAVPAAEADKNDGFMQTVERWQSRMSGTFRDTWKNLRGEAEKASVSTASVDLREQKESYTVRLDLPGHNTQKVSVTLDGDTLRIVAPADGKASRYEQTLALAGVAPGAALKIERMDRDGVIVVTVPKSPGIAKSPPAVVPGTLPPPMTHWERDFLQRMDRMRKEMDRVFNESLAEFNPSAEQNGYFDEFNFGSSVDLKEVGSNYVVTTYLPERDMQNITATIDGQSLKIEAKAESTPATAHRARYLQVLSLPGPVQADKMKVERKEGVLTVTLPKA